MGVVTSWIPAARVGIVVTAVVALLVVRWLDRHIDWGRRRRARLLLGIPWGTLLSIAFVLAVYLFVQGGINRWNRPVTVAYRSWSYFYPLGLLTAPFAHNGPNHLTGNLIGALVLGSLAEYAWGHFPRELGSAAFDSWRTNPYVRAFVVFPGGVVAVGLASSLFSWGPIIGFSAIVFAFAGFALLRYPLLTVVALEADDVVRIAVRGLREPILVSKAKPQFVEPWWAGIAIQGHLLGLFLGIVAGAFVLRHRRTSARRLIAGTLVLATSLSLWALWWFRGNQEFVLFRASGVIFVILLALLVTVGMDAREQEWGRLPVPSRQAGLVLLVFPVLVIGMVAVPLNLATVADATPPGETTVSVRDYTITYAENVTNEQTSIVNLSLFGETTAVRTSGVIVISEDRHIWTTALSTSRLKFAGQTTVAVGGLGWREAVPVRRRGWTVPGNGSAYRIWMKPPGADWTPAYHSEPAMAEPVLAGQRVSVVPKSDGFYLEITRNNTTVSLVPMPTENVSVAGGDGLRFVRDGRTVVAMFNETKVTVAKRETYKGQRNRD